MAMEDVIQIFDALGDPIDSLVYLRQLKTPALPPPISYLITQQPSNPPIQQIKPTAIRTVRLRHLRLRFQQPSDKRGRVPQLLLNHALDLVSFMLVIAGQFAT